MGSFIQYSCGATGEWLFIHIGGLEICIEYAGYIHILLHSDRGGGSTYTNAEFYRAVGKLNPTLK